MGSVSSSDVTSAVFELLLYIGPLVLVLCAGGVGWWVFRGKLKAPPDATPNFDLDSIAKMRASGQISEDEYKALRQQLIAEMKL